MAVKIKCTYCGEAEGKNRIPNPNLNLADEIDWKNERNWWMICKDCRDTIHWQRKMSISKALQDEDGVVECMAKLESIANRTKKPIMNAVIYQKKDGKYGSASVEFTGDSK